MTNDAVQSSSTPRGSAPQEATGNADMSDDSATPQRRRLKWVVVPVIVIATLASAAVAVAQAQRFSDVPAEHPAYDAIEWASEAGVTAGYNDGTFKPERPLSKRHALVFMERYYDEILGADESDDFTRADMMALLHAIDGGAYVPGKGSTAEESGNSRDEPEDTARRWISTPENRKAEGRCAPAIVLGIYDWENCAWGDSDDPELSRREMEALVEKVWAETRARGKPDVPPTLEEGYCGLEALGCYLPSTHTIRLSTGFTLRTILHELAHALISENDALSACDDDWTHRQPQCSHGDLYRCAADTLYSRYGGIKTAGVCGTPPDLDPGDWLLGEPSETEWGVIHAAAGVTDEGQEYFLFVRCATTYSISADRAFNLFLTLPRDFFSSAYEAEVTHRFSGGRPTTSQWYVGSESSDVLWYDGDTGAFVDKLESGGTLFMSVQYNTRDTERFSFDLGDSPAVAIVTEACN